MTPLPHEARSKEKSQCTKVTGAELPRGSIVEPNMAAVHVQPPPRSLALPPIPHQEHLSRRLPPSFPDIRGPRNTLPPIQVSPTPSPTSTSSWSFAGQHSFVQHSPTVPTGTHSALLGELPRPPYPENAFHRQDAVPHGTKRPYSGDKLRRPSRETPTNQTFAPLLPGAVPRSTYAPAVLNTGPKSREPMPSSTSGYGAQVQITPKAKFTLHLRQHPRAARAGPDGKDRRTIDPPPVLQLLIDDFDREKHMSLLKAHDWVVHAKLVSADSPHQDMTSIAMQAEGSTSSKITRLLLGTTVSSPFFCSDDPDPADAPKHPSTSSKPPDSPTSRFLPMAKGDKAASKNPDAHKTYPGMFFIFADLSVRKAGQYRLEFRLMKLEPSALVPGNIIPTISTALSDVFNVVNAKDFDQVQPSTNLVRGLLDRGAPFPLKLKKGLREGQRRRTRGGDSDDDDEGHGRDPADDEEQDDEDD